MSWDELGDWWLAELAGDPDYAEAVEPLILHLLRPRSGGLYLDVGCGEGRLMGAVAQLGATAVGVDVLPDLLRRAGKQGPVIRLRLPSMAAVGSGVFDGAYVSLVLEHLADHRTVFEELARVTRPGGPLALVINHPIYTAPGSAPIDEGDEVLWRPGMYFGSGSTEEPVSGGTITFHHRSMGDLLTSAAKAGWNLGQLEEYGVSGAQIDRYPALAKQRHIPRLLGARWTRRTEG